MPLFRLALWGFLILCTTVIFLTGVVRNVRDAVREKPPPPRRRR